MRRRVTTLKTRTVLLSIVVCSFLCLAGIGYVWAKTEVYNLGRKIKSLEVQLEEMNRTNEALGRTYAAMCTPRELDARVKKLNLGLVPPQPENIVRMPDPVAGAMQKTYAARLEEDVRTR